MHARSQFFVGHFMIVLRKSHLYSYKAYSQRNISGFKVSRSRCRLRVTFQQWLTTLRMSPCLLSHSMWLEQLAPCMLFYSSLSKLCINIPNARTSSFLCKPVLQYLPNKICAWAVISDYTLPLVYIASFPVVTSTKLCVNLNAFPFSSNG